MKRRSLTLSAAILFLSSMVISTGCADTRLGDQSYTEMPTPSTTTYQTSLVTTEAISTATFLATTESITTETTTQPTTTQAQTTTTTTSTTLTAQPTTQETTSTSLTWFVLQTSATISTTPAVSSTTTTTTTTTTAAPVVTAPVVPTTQQTGFQDLPDSLMQIVNRYKAKYPGMSIGVGIYSLDGQSGYEYNAYQLFNGACTIKASYALYVCTYCDNNGIDIWSRKIYYDTTKHHHGGSGVLYNEGSKWYTIGELLTYLLQVSDNDAMKCLITEFLNMDGYYQFNSALGGEDDWRNWNGGQASIRQRRNEWIAIWNYVNSDAPNAQNLKTFLTNTKYCYLVMGMSYVPPYMHKSGWCDTFDYPAAADCAIITNRTGSYLMIVMNQDYSTGGGHTDVIKELGNAIDDYWYEPGFFWRN